jgi:hypothetical protein
VGWPTGRRSWSTPGPSPPPGPGTVVEPEAAEAYLKTRKKGLTRTGLLYWIVNRIQLAGLPFVGGPPLPAVDEKEPGLGLPAGLGEG